MGLIPRYGLDSLRRTVVRLGASLGLPPSQSSIWARRLLWAEVNGRHQDGLSTVPSSLLQLQQGSILPSEVPWLAPLPNQEGVGIHAARAFPPHVLHRASETAAELARSRPLVGVGIVRIWGLDHVPTAAADIADLALGPFEGFCFGPKDAWLASWPTHFGLPLLYDGLRAGTPFGQESLSSTGLPPIPWVEPGNDGEIVIVARAIRPEVELARVHASLDPILARIPRSGEAGMLHPEAQRQGRQNAETQGLSLSGVLVSQLTEWAHQFNIPFPSPVDDPEVQRSW